MNEKLETPNPEQGNIEEQPAGMEQPVVKSESVVETPPESVPEMSAAPRKGALYVLFSPETRMGRFLRPLVRWLAIIVGLFALGFLTAYLLLYRPEYASRLDAQKQIATLQQELKETKSELTKTAADLKAVQERYDATKTEAEKLAVRVQIAAVIQNALEAQNALANREQGIARQAVTSAKAALEKVQPAIRGKNPALADDLMTRLQLAISEMERDPKTAQKDLRILVDSLQKVDELFK